MRLLLLADPPLEGEDVRKVQQALVNEGFLTEEQVNGVYDEDTKEAVKKFQEEEELRVDGIVGPQTRRALGIPR
ncbi:MAG: peptidoglycan-binding domain-containing protein [Prochloraceae cyanobacterium]|nr:peptidoglycan-binding domain-containing protein [Prochloraceae cyanobacterium]